MTNWKAWINSHFLKKGTEIVIKSIKRACLNIFYCYFKRFLIFTQLKYILFILIFFLGLNFTSFAQNIAPAPTAAVQAKFIKSYPNPASDVVTFEFQKGYSRSYSIRVLNSIGKQVYEAKNIPSILTINLKDEKFFRGIYIYQLVDKNGLVIESGKILVVN